MEPFTNGLAIDHDEGPAPQIYFQEGPAQPAQGRLEAARPGRHAQASLKQQVHIQPVQLTGSNEPCQRLVLDLPIKINLSRSSGAGDSGPRRQPWPGQQLEYRFEGLRSAGEAQPSWFTQ